MTTEKSRENRLRRAATRQGLRLEKSKRRDTRAYDYGVYYLIDGPARHRNNWRARILVTSEYGCSLDEIQAYLTGADEPVSV